MINLCPEALRKNWLWGRALDAPFRRRQSLGRGGDSSELGSAEPALWCFSKSGGEGWG